jgi:hypothetical protein
MRFPRRLLLLPLLLLLASCGGYGPQGQPQPILLYGAGKCTVMGQAAAGVAVAAGGNSFMISSDCGPGAYIYSGPPPANFNPPASAPANLIKPQ